ncbi:MAG: tyrosine-type recombinase/integrase [Spirochaetia bacterium]
MRTNRKHGKEFWQYVRAYLTVYLPKIRSLSPKTIESYTQSIAAFCSFLSEDSRIKLSGVTFEHVTRESIKKFIQSLRSRSCRASTCNLRLSSIKSFLKYCADEDISLYSVYQEAKRIPMMKPPKTPVHYMSEAALKTLLTEPDVKTVKGFRNRMIIMLLYDTGTRVQELVDMKVADLHLAARNPFVIVKGKGGKTRSIPLMEKTISHLKEYLRRFHTNSREPTNAPLFYSMRKGIPQNLSTDAVAVMLKTYGDSARITCSEVPERVHPHLIRHTRAMHLYRSGMPLSYVAEFLGHASMNTTEIYASASVEMLREAMEKVDPQSSQEIPAWKEEETLRRLCGL